MIHLQSGRRVLIAVGLAMAAPHVAAADPSDQPFHAADWRVVPSLAFGVEAFDYHESVPAPLKSKHHGVLPTARLAAEVTAPGGHFYARAAFGATRGAMPLDGSDQVGNPLTGDATGYMTDTEGVLGARAGLGHHAWLGGYAGLGHRTWRRDLSPIQPGGYLEEYSWSYVPVAAVLELAVAPQVSLAADAALMVPFGGNLRAHFTDVSPAYSDLDIVLNNDFGGRARITASWAASAQLQLTLAAGYETTAVIQGPSTPFLMNGKPATDSNGNAIGVSEPYTHTTRMTLAAGAAYAF